MKTLGKGAVGWWSESGAAGERAGGGASSDATTLTTSTLVADSVAEGALECAEEADSESDVSEISGAGREVRRDDDTLGVLRILGGMSGADVWWKRRGSSAGGEIRGEGV